MGIRMIFHDAPSPEEIKESFAAAGVPLNADHEAFLREHEGHCGITMDDDRISCRTCDESRTR